MTSIKIDKSFNDGNLPAEKGTYILIFKIDKPEFIQIGKLGRFKFEKGFYLYTGSAFGGGGLKSRLSRHLKNKKKLHWHIDYFTNKIKISEILYSTHPEKLECFWAEKLRSEKQFKYSIKNFGCGDCKCESHLFYFNKLYRTRIERIKQIYTD